MRPGQPFARFVAWAAKGDRPFIIVLWTLCPPLLALTVLGFF